MISWPEFYIDDKWIPAFEILNCEVEILHLHEKFLDIGLKRTINLVDPKKWKRLPIEKLVDKGSYYKPIEFLNCSEFISPILEIKRRLFAGFIYIG